MIKINLAVKRSQGLNLGGFTPPAQLANLNLELLKDLPIRKLLAPLIICFVVNQGIESYKREELKTLGIETDKLNGEGAKIQTEIGKYKSYDSIKKAFDQDEVTIRTKLDTIKKLLENRNGPFRLLMSIASGIPKEVWLQDLKIEKTSLHFVGSALGYSQVSDFLKSLNENAFLAEVDLKESTQGKGPGGVDIATFDITAKRR